MPGRPRVVFAIGGLGRGGSERQLMQLVAAAHPEQIEAVILTLSTTCDPGHRQLLDELGVKLIQLSPSGGPRVMRPAVALPRARSALRRIRPDVVYAWLEEASAVTALPARSLGIPLVIARRSVRGSNAERWPFFRIPIRMVERRATLVTGNSDSVIEVAKERGVPSGRLRLVRNGHEPVPPLPPPDGDEVAIGYVANYRAEKGHERLLSALQLVDTERPWRVDLAGSGPLLEQVAAEVLRRGLAGRVKAGGPVSDIRRFWAEHDIAALLSDDEGSPNALIEAAMAGRPLIGTNGGGTAEIVAGDAGILVSHDPAEIARAFERLIDEPELRRSLGEGARRHALEQHDFDKFVEGHVAVLNEALGQGGAGSLRDG